MRGLIWLVSGVILYRSWLEAQRSGGDGLAWLILGLACTTLAVLFPTHKRLGDRAARWITTGWVICGILLATLTIIAPFPLGPVSEERFYLVFVFWLVAGSYTGWLLFPS